MFKAFRRYIGGGRTPAQLPGYGERFKCVHKLRWKSEIHVHGVQSIVPIRDWPEEARTTPSTARRFRVFRVQCALPHRRRTIAAQRDGSQDFQVSAVRFEIRVG